MFVVNNKINGKWIKSKFNGARMQSHTRFSIAITLSLLSPQVFGRGSSSAASAADVASRPRGQPRCKNTPAGGTRRLESEN